MTADQEVVIRRVAALLNEAYQLTTMHLRSEIPTHIRGSIATANYCVETKIKKLEESRGSVAVSDAQ